MEENQAGIPQPERYHAFDALRAVALLLGIVLHAASSFVPGNPSWAIVDNSTSLVMVLLIFVIHVFRLAAFFLMAGFFGRLVLERKGESSFVRDRLKRILLPFAGGWCVLFPLIATVWIWGAQRSGGGFLPPEAHNLPAPLVAAFGIVRGAIFKDGVSLGHLWFLYYLLMIYGLFLIARRLWPQALSVDGVVRAVLSNPIGVVVLAIPAIAALSFSPHQFGVPTPDRNLLPEWKTLTAYGSFFVVGWLLHRQTGLLDVLRRRWILNLVLALLFTFLALAVIDKGRGRWGVAGARQWIYAASYALSMWTWVFGLAGLFLRRFSHPSVLWRYISDSSYWLYLTHLPLVTFLQVAVARLPWHWSVKYGLILAVSFPVLLVSYDVLVRNTPLGAILNGRRRPRFFDTISPPALVPSEAGQ